MEQLCPERLVEEYGYIYTDGWVFRGIDGHLVEYQKIGRVWKPLETLPPLKIEPNVGYLRINLNATTGTPTLSDFETSVKKLRDSCTRKEEKPMTEVRTRNFTGGSCAKPIDSTRKCPGTGIKEFVGLCPTCWLKLTPAQRSLLLNGEPPVVVEQKITRYEPVSVWTVVKSAATGLLILGNTAVLSKLFYVFVLMHH